MDPGRWSCGIGISSPRLTCHPKGQACRALDLIWITDSEDVQLFRPGAAFPLRGTFLHLGAEEHALYTGGSVESYSTYPGMQSTPPGGNTPGPLDPQPT
jgi:hypothetical protein